MLFVRFAWPADVGSRSHDSQCDALIPMGNDYVSNNIHLYVTVYYAISSPFECAHLLLLCQEIGVHVGHTALDAVASRSNWLGLVADDRLSQQ